MPHCALPPAMLSTSQVTVVVVDTVESVNVTTAVNSACPPIETGALAGVMATDFTVVEPEPPPQPSRPNTTATGEPRERVSPRTPHLA